MRGSASAVFGVLPGEGVGARSGGDVPAVGEVDLGGCTGRHGGFEGGVLAVEAPDTAGLAIGGVNGRFGVGEADADDGGDADGAVAGQADQPCDRVRCRRL